jgi:hypothetical protein
MVQKICSGFGYYKISKVVCKMAYKDIGFSPVKFLQSWSNVSVFHNRLIFLEKIKIKIAIKIKSSDFTAYKVHGRELALAFAVLV